MLFVWHEVVFSFCRQDIYFLCSNLWKKFEKNHETEKKEIELSLRFIYEWGFSFNFVLE